MNRTSTRIFIVEDSPPIRERLEQVISAAANVEIVGSAESPSEAIAGILRTEPDCVVLDYQLLGGTGVEVLRAVRPMLPTTAFVVLSNHSSPQYRRVCVEAGAAAFLDKSTEFEKVTEVIANLVPLVN